MASFSALRAQVLDREERRRHYAAELMGLNAYDRHKKFMNDYGFWFASARCFDKGRLKVVCLLTQSILKEGEVLHYGKMSSGVEQKRPIKTDQDTLRETYRFIRTEEDDLDSSWEQRLAKRYYDKLFKEYCIADMVRYKDGKIGMRWRAEKEVVSGKGQFVCGNKSCDAKDDLSSYEVNFTYKEAGESKQALVKLRVCPGCGEKLNYRRGRDREKLKELHEEHDKRSKSEERPWHPDKCLRSSKKRRREDVQQISNDDANGEKESIHLTRRYSLSPPAQGGSKLARSTSSEKEDDKYFNGMFL